MNLNNPESSMLIDTLLEHKHVKEHIEHLREHHEESLDHSVRVGKLAVDLGLENDLSHEDVVLLGMAGILHDVGKSDIDLSLLNKRSRLTPEEKEAMGAHVALGQKRLAHTVLSRVEEIVANHHAYDLFTSEEDESDPTRSLTEILAVADVFDALTHARSYKQPFAKNDVATHMLLKFPRGRYVQQALNRY